MNGKLTSNCSTQPSILVIRHESCTSLGLLEMAAVQCSSSIRYLEIAAGESLPVREIDRYSHLVILGGAMSAYEEELYPFLRHEFRLVEAAIDRGIPTLGICLESQVLARVLGAKVYRGKAGREAGWYEVETTDAAADDFLLRDFPRKFNVFQFHQDTFELPTGAVHLAQSKAYPNQAFCYHKYIWALQFHLEFDQILLGQCADLLEQDLRRERINGASLEQFSAAAQQQDHKIAPIADRCMHHFLNVSMQGASVAKACS